MPVRRSFGEGGLRDSMYYYIIDPKDINQKAYERVQNKLYSSLSSYRISGETVRVTGLRTIPQLVELALSHGAKTIVAVGSDDTLNEVINAVKGRELIVGFVPLMNTELSKILGLTDVEQACKTLATRRITTLDLGIINNNFFLSKISFGVCQEFQDIGAFNFSGIRKLFNVPDFELKFSGNGEFQGTHKVIGGIILNSRFQEDGEKIASPTDGVLDVLLLPRLSKLTMFKNRKNIAAGLLEKVPNSSLLHVTKMSIDSPAGLPLKVGSKLLAKTPANISVLTQAVKIIVGKDRTF